MELLIKSPELKELARRIVHGLATEDDFRNAKQEDVWAIKANSGEVHYRTAADPIERATTDAPRTKKYVASDESVDRMGDIIRVNGWQLETFAKNPQALWAHDARQLPIGSVQDMHKGQRNGSPALIETIKYLPEGTTPAADLVWRLVEQGVVRAVSVGFVPMKSVWIDDPKEREKLGLGPWGVVYERQEQLELSNCSIPANPNALATKSIGDALREMIAAGQISERDAEEVADLTKTATKTQVVVPDGVPPAKSADDEPAEAWMFVVGKDGKARATKVDPKTGEPPAAAEAAAEPEAVELSLEERIDELESLVVSLAEGVAAMREEIRSLPKLLTEAVGRSFMDRSALQKRMLEAAVDSTAQRLSREPL